MKFRNYKPYSYNALGCLHESCTNIAVTKFITMEEKSIWCSTKTKCPLGIRYTHNIGFI